MILIVGGDSEVGRDVVRLAGARGLPVAATTRRRDRVGNGWSFLELDALDENWQPPESVTAACICAAVARLAACASDPEGSARVNVRGTVRLARRLAEAGVYTLFLSTNQVFDGTRPHMPADAPLSPVSAYGKQKAQTEWALHAMMRECHAIGILRLAKVVSPGMALLAAWQAELAAGRPVRAFHDMMMAPVALAQVAETILTMLERRERVVAQLAGPEDMAYADVARLIASHVGASPGLISEASARDYGQPEGSTPRHTTLDSSYLREACSIEIASAEKVILEVMAWRPRSREVV